MNWLKGSYLYMNGMDYKFIRTVNMDQKVLLEKVFSNWFKCHLTEQIEQNMNSTKDRQKDKPSGRKR